jgi:hypothetical protein
MSAACRFWLLANFYQTTWHHISKDNILGGSIRVVSWRGTVLVACCKASHTYQISEPEMSILRCWGAALRRRWHGALVYAHAFHTVGWLYLPHSQKWGLTNTFPATQISGTWREGHSLATPSILPVLTRALSIPFGFTELCRVSKILGNSDCVGQQVPFQFCSLCPTI